DDWNSEEPVIVCFFFQAEDGIRDFHVTGVQTCALPICPRNTGIRVSTKAAMVPSATAAMAVYRAISSERITAPISWVLSSRPMYHFSDQPPHTVTRREALNE